MHWFKAVTIKAAPGMMQGVSSVEAALEVMRGWPVKPKLRAAYIACAEVLDGIGTVEAAREAFVAAAREAGVLREGG
ncbi:DUF982 domain-containing protein [Mesorhizobium abyssinicae]|uniref:DUF982 domain-containing protein n=1 Tax=Mesorhizobium abyssinicae TaxID=1209958 RepID=A0ABU5AID3_9HYPH|nr:DUF982 domain-containing protein [Mesorhizobium abyssinicae]MDX8537046.1 DUF982 domain-containing protein [Mesorhizobium abyssinicae]